GAGGVPPRLVRSARPRRGRQTRVEGGGTPPPPRPRARRTSRRGPGGWRRRQGWRGGPRRTPPARGSPDQRSSVPRSDVFVPRRHLVSRPVVTLAPAPHRPRNSRARAAPAGAGGRGRRRPCNPLLPARGPAWRGGASLARPTAARARRRPPRRVTRRGASTRPDGRRQVGKG